MRLAIFGGSFNPIHNGHAMLAETVIKELGYDKVLFIPTCIPPHKEICGGATTQQRLDMVEAFCKSEKRGWFQLETCEVDRGGVSYTYDTLMYIHEKYKDQLDGKPGLLMGEEIAAEFHKWYKADKVAEQADLVIVPRQQDYSAKKNESHMNKPTGLYNGDFNTAFDEKSFKYKCTQLSSPVLKVSSTEIRSRVASGKSYKYLVPGPVFEYIENNGIYKNSVSE